MITLCELEMSGMSTLHIRLRFIPPALSAVEFVGFLSFLWQLYRLGVYSCSQESIDYAEIPLRLSLLPFGQNSQFLIQP